MHAAYGSASLHARRRDFRRPVYGLGQVRVHMAEPPATLLGQWAFGPLQVWALAHAPGASGEPPARPLLEHWLSLPAGTLPLERDRRGRPRLLPPLQRYDTGWTHSGQALLVAAGQDVQLGVDLERLRPRPRALDLAQRFFAPEETAWLRQLPEPRQQPAFLQLWCAKEAVLKAHGHGISFGLHRLRFAIQGDALVLVACAPELGQATQWRLHEFFPLPGYRAALAWRPCPVPGATRP